MDQKLIKILLIEDNPDDALLIRKALSGPSDDALEMNLRFEIEWAESLKGGIERLEKGTFNIILLDLGLPDSYGLDSIEKLHSEADIPIVVLTGLNDGQMGMKALRKGAQDFLVKERALNNLLLRSVCYAIERHKIHKEMNEMREEFITVLTHDLKSPVASILGYAELIADPESGEISDRKLEYAQNIQHSGARLLNSINNIVETSKIEAGQMKIMFENFLISDLLKELRITFEPLAIKNKINLDFSCPEGTSIYADIGKIREIFQNLISNALRYTPKGGTISIKVNPQDECVAIEVADTGCGITESEQKKLFKKFVTVNDRLQKTGMGLYIVKNFLKGHNSDIHLKSEQGKGTSFFFNLPKKEFAKK